MEENTLVKIESKMFDTAKALWPYLMIELSIGP